MCQLPDWAEGDRYLAAHAPELAPLIQEFSPCPLQPKKAEAYFTILLSGIIAQQLPPHVSQELMRQMENLLGNPITPQAVLAVSVAELCDIGLVPQKIDYAKNFAAAIIDGKVTFEQFPEMNDSQITKQLMQVRGLGQWTIEMFLLLALCRTDVIPTADFIFKKELQALLHLQEIPKRGLINQLTAHWRPWRSLAVWYMWQHAGKNAKK